METRPVADWNPELYRRFEDERTRPARDLLAQVPLDRPASVVDLGCGPGNSTELLVERFPDARIVGVDNSAAMLESARARLAEPSFELADIAQWRPDGPVDLIFANASLQWLGDHDGLLPRLVGMLAPGGVLAIQMPENREEPSHRLMREVAAGEPWAETIRTGMRERTAVLDVGRYYDLLVGAGAVAELWRTIYHHRMPDAAAIVQWVSSTGLRPFLDALPEHWRASFLKQYEARIAEAYPPQADGQRLLRFPRLFMVARRPVAD